MLDRLAISAMVLAALSSPLLAQGRRPDARQMTCDQVYDLISQRGAVVLTTGRHTYDRYVASTRFCALGEATTAVAISTRDTNRCWVYRCQMVDFD